MIGLRETHVIDEDTKTFTLKKKQQQSDIRTFLQWNQKPKHLFWHWNSHWKRPSPLFQTNDRQNINYQFPIQWQTRSPCHRCLCSNPRSKLKRAPDLRGLLQWAWKSHLKACWKQTPTSHPRWRQCENRLWTKLYPTNIGQYGKGHLKSNGEHLLEYTKENYLILTNTLFYHKLDHRITWSPLEHVNPHLSREILIETR